MAQKVIITGFESLDRMIGTDTAKEWYRDGQGCLHFGIDMADVFGVDRTDDAW